MSAPITFPIRTLRDEILALGTVLSACLTEPNLRAVHRLRTGTRRLEAQLLLLELLPSVPPHREPAATLRRELRRLRRAAGEVRDLDVQGKHLELLGNSESSQNALQTALPTATPPAEAGTTSDQDDALSNTLNSGSGRLAERLSRKRTKAATALQRILGRRQTKTADAAEALLHVFRTDGDLSLSAEHLIHAAETVLYRDGLLRGAGTGKLDEEELHAVRKSAKLARYLAETMPGHPAVKAAAARFEALQEAGGLWHDALEIARVTAKHLGRHHPLTAALSAQSKAHLRAYREALRAVPGPQLSLKTDLQPSLKPNTEPVSGSSSGSVLPPRRSRSQPSPGRPPGTHAARRRPTSAKKLSRPKSTVQPSR